jgi:hypothetical protein
MGKSVPPSLSPYLPISLNPHLPIRPSSFRRPPEFHQVHPPLPIKPDSFLLQQPPLAEGSVSPGARADLTPVVYYPMPGDGPILGKSRQGIPHHPRRAPSDNFRDLPVGGDLPARDSFYRFIDLLMKSEIGRHQLSVRSSLRRHRGQRELFSRRA